jgi:hypothetical protein
VKQGGESWSLGGSLLARLVVLLCLLTAPAWAQLSRGGALKKRQYQTYSALTFYVDPSGNDANSCTSPSAPCATLGSVLSRIPFLVRHPVTVNVAAGTYDEAVSFPAFHFGRDDIDNGSITINGAARVAPTLSSGTTSGALTSTGGTYGFSYTDASQSWTPDELVGYFFEFTSGAMNGQVCPIVANTATTVRTGCAFSNASPGDTYVIRTTSSNFTTFSGWSISGLVGAETELVVFEDLGLLDMGTPTRFVTVESNVGGVRFERCRIIEGPWPSTALDIKAKTTLERSFVHGTIRVSSGSAPSPTLSYLNSAAVDMWGGPVIELNGSVRTSPLAFYGIARGNPPVSGVISVGTGADVNIGYPLRFAVLCELPTNKGVTLEESIFGTGGTVSASLVVEGCEVGLDLDARNASVTVFSPPSFTNTTTAISVKSGSSLRLTFPPTFTGVTNELQVDGENFTYSFLNGLSPSVITGPYGSRIFK